MVTPKARSSGFCGDQVTPEQCAGACIALVRTAFAVLEIFDAAPIQHTDPNMQADNSAAGRRHSSIENCAQAGSQSEPPFGRTDPTWRFRKGREGLGRQIGVGN